MSGRPKLALVAVAAFAVGVGLMVPFEATITRVAGLIALAVFVGCGLTAIAEPGFLAADAGDDQPAPSPDEPGSRTSS